MNIQSDISHFHDIPALEELQARDQGVCWRKERREKKLTKVPYNPQTGRWARSNDPGTWASYAIARSAYEHSRTTRHSYDGIGYMFLDDITGIDLDHCMTEDGALDDWAQSYSLEKSVQRRKPHWFPAASRILPIQGRYDLSKVTMSQKRANGSREEEKEASYDTLS